MGKTNFERITDSPVALATELSRWGDEDTAPLWCDTDESSVCYERLDCDHEKALSCIVRWLHQESDE